MPRVVHFEIPSDDPQRAVKFYQEAFGWEIGTWGGPGEYFLATTGPDSEPGINGAIMRREGQTGVVNTIGVGSYEEAVEKVLKAGGKVLTPEEPVPSIGWFSYCADTEGNTFGIMQPDPSAK